MNLTTIAVWTAGRDYHEWEKVTAGSFMGYMAAEGYAWCWIHPGDRVLFVVRDDTGAILAVPEGKLDEMRKSLEPPRDCLRAANEIAEGEHVRKEGVRRWDPTGPTASFGEMVTMKDGFVAKFVAFAKSETAQGTRDDVTKQPTPARQERRCGPLPKPLHVELLPSARPSDESVWRDSLSLTAPPHANEQSCLFVAARVSDLEKAALSQWRRTHREWPLCRLGGTINLVWSRFGRGAVWGSVGTFTCSICDKKT